MDLQIELPTTELESEVAKITLIAISYASYHDLSLMPISEPSVFIAMQKLSLDASLVCH